VNAWCDVFSRFVAVGTRVSVGVVCSSIFLSTNKTHCTHENT